MYTAKLAMTAAYQYIPTLLDAFFVAKSMTKPYIANAEMLEFTGFFSNVNPIILTKAPPNQQDGTEAQLRLLPEESDKFETASGWYAKAAVGDYLIIEQAF